MKFREFLNTCENDGTIHVYLDDLAWDDGDPSYSTRDMRAIPRDDLARHVDAWYVDANFGIHALLS